MMQSNRFPTTAWSLLDKAADPQGKDATAAMNRFMVRYWRPVFYFVRARGYRADVAEDLTQDFFLKLLKSVQHLFRYLVFELECTGGLCHHTTLLIMSASTSLETLSTILICTLRLSPHGSVAEPSTA